MHYNNMPAMIIQCWYLYKSWCELNEEWAKISEMTEWSLPVTDINLCLVPKYFRDNTEKKCHFSLMQKTRNPSKFQLVRFCLYKQPFLVSY